jgi:hypothetical protein
LRKLVAQAPSPLNHSLWIDTMNRCPVPPHGATRRTALMALAALGLGSTVQAQTLKRQFPAKALRGKLVVQQPPWVTIDGKTAQLSPGSRIRNTNNSLVLSASLVGQELTVNYLRDGMGLVHEVWILNAVEVAEKRPTAADLD